MNLKLIIIVSLAKVLFQNRRIISTNSLYLPTWKDQERGYWNQQTLLLLQGNMCFKDYFIIETLTFCLMEYYIIWSEKMIALRKG